MKIMMTADTVGGVWTYAVDLSAALRSRGAEVILCTMGEPLTDAQWAQVKKAGISVHESRYKLEWMPDPWRDVELAGQWLTHLNRRERPDIMHLNGYAHAALPLMGRKLIVVHSCVLSWWKAVKGEPAPGEWQIYAQAVRKGVQSAEYVVAPTAAMMKAFEAEHGVCACRQVIFNGRDASLYQQREEKEPLVLAAGRLWDEAKNLAVLNRVAGRISWPIYVAGSLDHPSGRPPEPPQVEPLGELPADILADWMSRAAIYVHPARYEPFGLSVLEAALSGCALLLGDIPSLREVWGDAAIYVPPDNADCLRDTLEKLIQHEPRRRELGQLAYRRALQLTPQRMADNYLALYRRLQVMPRQQAGMPAPTPPRRSPFHLRPGASA